MKNDFEQIGVKLNVTPLDATSAFSELAGPKNDYATFDMFMFTFIGNYLPGGTLPVFRCDAIGSYSYTGTCSKQFDALDNAQVAATSQATALKYVQDEQRWVLTHRPILNIAYLNDIYAYRNGWTGFQAGPTGWFYLTHETGVNIAKQ
jgi:ABC-type transport system substrate-binding protein